MKLFIVAALVLVADALSVKEEWQQFKMDHGKTYRSLREERHRFSIFQDNLQLIQEHNEKYDKGEVTYALKITEFADMTHQEFLDFMKIKPISAPSNRRGRFAPTGGEIPKSKDWRKEGAVTAVKYQGPRCGSCWAFSTTGSIEGQLFRTNGTLLSLSEQNLMDCDIVNAACNGGNMEVAYDYVIGNGITTEDEYPYEAEKGKCRVDGHPTIKIKDYVDIDADEDLITKGLALAGPLSDAISVWRHISLYSHGIIDESSGCDNKQESLNHAILLVGYGEEAGVPYYIVKNSWGAKWGENGYFRLKKNVNACGIKFYSSFPTM
uniref:Cathepsin L4 n=1 Tax=Zabrotes subfasciatus TaxID=122865 RepID=A0A8K1XCI9_ZABSU|nr:cathepsin L4 [Zabrotes subfasciatus]